MKKTIKTSCFAVLAAAYALSLHAAVFDTGAIHVEWNEHELTVANSTFRAVFGQKEGALVPLSMKTSHGTELLKPEISQGGDPLSVECRVDRMSPASEESVLVKVSSGKVEPKFTPIEYGRFLD